MIRHTTPRPAPAPAPASRVAWLAEQHAVTTHELSRRLNVPLVELALTLEPLVAARAKERQRAAGGALPQKSAEPPIDTRDEVAALAGMADPKTNWSQGTTRAKLAAEPGAARRRPRPNTAANRGMKGLDNE